MKLAAPRSVQTGIERNRTSDKSHSSTAEGDEQRREEQPLEQVLADGAGRPGSARGHRRGVAGVWRRAAPAISTRS